MLKELLLLIQKKDVLEIQSDLVELHEMEVFSTKVYFEQIRRFEGAIVETLKILLEQEEKHAYVLQKLLDKVNYKKEKTEYFNVDDVLTNAVKYDINLENDATKKYEETIKKSSSNNMKKFLTHILEEEFAHIKRLEKFLKEN